MSFQELFLTAFSSFQTSVAVPVIPRLTRAHHSGVQMDVVTAHQISDQVESPKGKCCCQFTQVNV